MSDKQKSEDKSEDQSTGPVSEAPPADKFVDTNAGPDAVQGTVAEAGPTDIGGQKPMNE